MQSEPLHSSEFSGWISSALRMARRPATIFQRASVWHILLLGGGCLLIAPSANHIMRDH